MLFARILPVTFVDFCYGGCCGSTSTSIPSFFHQSYGLELNKFALLGAGASRRRGSRHGAAVLRPPVRRTGGLEVARRARAGRRAVRLVRVRPADALRSPALVDHGVPRRGVLPARAEQPVLSSIPMDIAPNHAGTAADEHQFGIAGIARRSFSAISSTVTASFVAWFTLFAAVGHRGCGAPGSIPPSGCPERVARRARRRLVEVWRPGRAWQPSASVTRRPQSWKPRA